MIFSVPCAVCGIGHAPITSPAKAPVFTNGKNFLKNLGALLKEGELVPLADQEVRVVHLPGHTPGHIGLFFKEADLLFTADVDLTPLGPWYANIPSNIDDFLRSLRRLRDWECTYYITSHGTRLYDREKFLKKLGRFTERRRTGALGGPRSPSRPPAGPHAGTHRVIF